MSRTIEGSDRLIEVPTITSVSEQAVDSSAGCLMPELSVEPRWYRRTWLAAALVIVVLYSALVFRFWAGADSGVDQNAYLVGGRLLAEHGSMKYVLPNPYSYVGGMFVRVTPPIESGGTYFPKYPFGLPLLYACVFWGFRVATAIPGLHSHVSIAQAAYWAFLVSPLSAIAAVAGMFFLARQVAGSFAAALSTILLGSSQLMMMLAENPNSHASCVAFIIWGMFFLIRWMQSGLQWHGVVGGLLVGYAATIRYSEILLFVAMCVVVTSRLPWNQFKTYRSLTVVLAPLAGGGMLWLRSQTTDTSDLAWLVLGLRLIPLSYFLVAIALIALGVTALVFSIMKLSRADWRTYLRALVPGLAWAVPVVALLLVNHHTMGSSTGYDSTHESEFGAAFQWKFFFANWEKVVRIFYDLGLFFVVPFAVAGIFMLFRRSWRVGALLLAWVVPGVMLYMSYYWSPDRADAYARFFLTFLPALLVGVAVCIHDGLLMSGESHLRWTTRWWRGERRGGGIALPIAAGVVVAMASGVSVYRTVHGLRDGTEATKIPLDDFRERLALAQTGQMLLANVPEKSVLFAENSGMIATPANYIQFVRDWEMYSVDAFSYEGSRRGFGGGGGRRNNGRNRPGGGPGGPGGPPNGGGNGQNDPNAVVATPVQPEQQLYHAGLYKNKTAHQLYQMESTDVIQKAFAEGRRVFVVVGTEKTEQTSNSPVNVWSNNADDAVHTFKDNLSHTDHAYTYKTIAMWQDVALPDDPEKDQADMNPWANMGGGGRGNNVMNRLFMAANRVLDWKLVEVKSATK